MKSNGDLLYDVDEKPPIMITLLLAIQHVLLIYSGIVIAPIILGKACNLPTETIQYLIVATILTSGITTFFQIKKVGVIGSGYLMFLGPSSSFLAAGIAAVHTGGLGMLAVLSILAAPLEIIFSFLLRYLRNIITPFVGGTVIMLVAFSLTPLAFDLLTATKTLPNTPLYALWIGSITFATIFFVSLQKKASIRLWAPVIGLASGILVSIILGVFNFAPIFEAKWIGLPAFHLPNWNITFDSTFFSLLVGFGIATIIGAVETTGDAMAVQEVSHKKEHTIDYNAIQGALYNDALGNVFAGFFGVLPNTTYSGNTPVISITGVASRSVGFVACGIMCFLAFVPKLTSFILGVPTPVFGGSMLFLNAVLFANGLNLLVDSGRLNFRNSLIVSFSLGMGLAAQQDLIFPELRPEALSALLSNGIATGGLTAIFLSTIFHFLPKDKTSTKFILSSHNFGKLYKYIQKSAMHFGLSETSSNELMIVCEELYQYLVPNQTEEKEFKISIEKESNLLKIEMISCSDTIPINLTQVKPSLIDNDELEKLGWLILKNLTMNLSGYNISGYSYYRFDLRLK